MLNIQFPTLLINMQIIPYDTYKFTQNTITYTRILLDRNTKQCDEHKQTLIQPQCACAHDIHSSIHHRQEYNSSTRSSRYQSVGAGYAVKCYLDQRRWWNAVSTRTQDAASAESRQMSLYPKCLWRQHNHWAGIRQGSVGERRARATSCWMQLWSDTRGLDTATSATARCRRLLYAPSRTALFTRTHWHWSWNVYYKFISTRIHMSMQRNFQITDHATLNFSAVRQCIP